MRVLITGANGFFGSHLVRFLNNKTDHEVTSMVRGTEGGPVTPGVESRHEIAYGDVSDIGDVSGIFNKTRPDVVIHFATRYAVSHESSDICEMVNTNIRGT